jgi:hypothetical protein
MPGSAVSNERKRELSQAIPIPPSPVRGLAHRRSAIIAIAVGALAGLVVLVVLVAAGGRKALEAGPGNGPVDQGGPPGGPIPPDGRPVPEGGSDQILGGGVVGFRVPEGWAVIARSDNKPGPGGHPENIVVVNRANNVTFAVFVLPQAPGSVNDEAVARTQEWVKDGDQPGVDAATGFETGGSVTSAAAVRFRYVLRGTGGGPREGQLVVAARQDGFAIAVVVEAPQGNLDGTSGVWGPLRGAALNNFASG